MADQNVVDRIEGSKSRSGENGIKKYEDLTFTDNFMFSKVLQNHPELCREIAELILGHKIGNIVTDDREHPIDINANGHGVRFDVYIRDDENTVADIEMQTRKYPFLPKRTRYYQSMIDLESLEKMHDYGELPESYVIFISLYNPFPKVDRHKYTFRNTCVEESGLELEDGVVKIFLSAKGSADDVSEEMRHFLEYLTSQRTGSDLTRRIEDAVQSAKTRKEWGAEYMTLEEELRYREQEGMQKGIKIGEERGEVKGLIGLVHDGLLAKDVGMQRALDEYEMSNEDFEKALKAYKPKKAGKT